MDIVEKLNYAIVSTGNRKTPEEIFLIKTLKEAKEKINELEHSKSQYIKALDEVVGLWATDKPEQLPKDKKTLFWEIEKPVITKKKSVLEQLKDDRDAYVSAFKKGGKNPKPWVVNGFSNAIAEIEKLNDTIYYLSK